MMTYKRKQYVRLMLAVMAVLWGGGTSIYHPQAADLTAQQRTVALEKITNGQFADLTDDEKAWFTSTLSWLNSNGDSMTIHKGRLDGTNTSNNRNSYITGNENKIKEDDNNKVYAHISGDGNRINYYDRVYWKAFRREGSDDRESDMLDINQAPLHIYGNGNVVGTEGTKMKEAFIAGHTNRLYVPKSSDADYMNKYIFGGENAAVVGRDFIIAGSQNLVGNGQFGFEDRMADPYYGHAIVFGHYNALAVTKTKQEGTNAALIVGYRNRITVNRGVALGLENHVSGFNGVSVGVMNNFTDDSDWYEDSSDKTADGKTQGDYSSAFGYGNRTPGDNSVAVGKLNYTKGNSAIAIGYRNNNHRFVYDRDAHQWKEVLPADPDENVPKLKSGDDSIAIGTSNTSTGNSSIVIGHINGGIGDKTTAIGFENVALGNYGSALGYQNEAGGVATTAIGFKNYAASTASVAMGYANIAKGQYDSVIGSWNALEEGDRSVVMGYHNVNIKGTKATVLGVDNQYQGFGGVVVGNQNNYVYQNAFRKDHPDISGDFVVVVGSDNAVSKTNTIAVGLNAQAHGRRSMSLGYGVANVGIESTLIGAEATIGGVRTIDNDGSGNRENTELYHALAVGAYSNADKSNAIALGSFSNTTRDAGMMGYNPKTGDAITVKDMLDASGGEDTFTEASYTEAYSKLSELRKDWLAKKEARVAKELLYQTGQVPGDERDAFIEEYKALSDAEDVASTNYTTAIATVGKASSAWQSQLAALSIGDESRGLTRQIMGVAAGTKDTDAVNVAQLKQLSKRVDTIKVTPTVDLSEYAKLDASNLAPTNVKQWKKKLGITDAPSMVTGDLGYTANGGTTKTVALADGLNFTNGTNTVATVGEHGVVTFDVAQNLLNIASISGKDKQLTLTGGDTTVTITSDGVDMGGAGIHHVAPGVADTDVATVGQVKDSVRQEISGMDHVLRNEIANTGALSAAMAALHPLGYRLEEPTQIMAGVGGYKGKQGVALGFAHYDNEDVLYHGGLAYSGSSLMWNAGVSVRVGSHGDSAAYNKRHIPTDVARELSSLHREVEQLKALNAQQASDNEALRQKVDYLMSKIQ